MRGRRGGFIGTQPQSGGGQLPGVWRASDILSLQRLNQWPNNTISATASPATLDVTQTGQGQIVASVTSPYPETTYRWEKSENDGQSWAVVAGQTGLILNLSGQTTSNDGDLYRVVATAGVRQGVSSPVEVRRETSINFFFSSQPQNTTSFAGSTVTIFAFASASGQTYGGSYEVAYQWQMSSDGGATWSDIQGQTQYLIEVTTSPGMNGRRYRVRVSAAGATANSNSMTLTVNSIQVSVSPSIADMTNTGSATFQATYATALPSPVLGWQRSTNGGATWTVLTGFEQNSEGVTLYQFNEENQLILNGLRSNQDTWLYRAAVTSGVNVAFSSPVRADWERTRAVITGQPEDVNASVGSAVQFNVEAHVIGLESGNIYTGGLVCVWEYLDFSSELGITGGYLWRSVTADVGVPSGDGKTLSVTVATLQSYSPLQRRLFRVLVSPLGGSSLGSSFEQSRVARIVVPGEIQYPY